VTLLPDTHCHLAHISQDVHQVLADAEQAGVGPVIDIGMGLVESRVSAERARSIAGVYACVGIHPNDLRDFETDPGAAMATLRDLAAAPDVVAIGETGMDLYRDRVTPQRQEVSFRAHIALSKEVDRTLVIHCRDAHDDVLRILDDEGAPPRTVMHCFSGGIAFARECADRAFFCSFAGNLTYKRNDDLRAAASVVPEELLLVETDAPYLAPLPFRGKPNAPALVVHTAEMLATTRSVSFDQLLQVLQVNTRRAFVI
jgi:TatD DNase family protein